LAPAPIDEELTGGALPERILFDAPTIRELARIAGGPAVEASPLVRIQEGGDAPPLFFFHSDFHNGGYYLRRPFWGRPSP
jgi:hypothetical protein